MPAVQPPLQLNKLAVKPGSQKRKQQEFIYWCGNLPKNLLHSLLQPSYEHLVVIARCQQTLDDILRIAIYSIIPHIGTWRIRERPGNDSWGMQDEFGITSLLEFNNSDSNIGYSTACCHARVGNEVPTYSLMILDCSIPQNPSARPQS
jgi:hypothetical protein